MDADDRIASLTYRTSRRLGWTTTRSPAGLESTRYPTPYTPESAFDIEAAAEHLDLPTRAGYSCIWRIPHPRDAC